MVGLGLPSHLLVLVLVVEAREWSEFLLDLTFTISRYLFRSFDELRLISMLLSDSEVVLE